MTVSIVLIVLVGILLKMMLAMRSEIERRETQISSLLERAEQILIAAAAMVETVGESTERILSQGEHAAERVNETVDRTTTIVQRTVYRPLISVNSVAAGLTRGILTFTNLQRTIPGQASMPPDAIPTIRHSGCAEVGVEALPTAVAGVAAGIPQSAAAGAGREWSNHG
jgi:hypothetical protein